MKYILPEIKNEFNGMKRLVNLKIQPWIPSKMKHAKGNN